MEKNGLRILFVLPYFVVGGTEEVALTLARYLRKQGNSVSFCLLHRISYEMLAEAERAGFPLFNWAELPIAQKIDRLKSLVKKFDIFHAHLSYTDGVVGAVLEDKPHAKVIITAQLPAMKLSAYQNVDVIAACCEYALLTLQSPKGAKTLSILNGSDVALSLPLISKQDAREKLNLPKIGPILGRISRLDEEKLSIPAYEAWKTILASNPKATAVFIGDGNIRARLLDLTRKDGLEGRLILPGSSRDRLTWLGAFDAFIYSTDADACPLALVEAMGSGLPIVAPNFCGIPELIRHHETGLIYAHNKWDEMCSATQLIIDEPDLASALSQRARESYLNALTGEAMCQRYSEIYSTVLKSSNAAQSLTAQSRVLIHCKIQISRVGFGHLGIRGELGYAGEVPRAIKEQSAGAISAHAPSRVVLRTESKGSIRIRALYDESVQGARSISHATVENLDGELIKDIGFFTPICPTEVFGLEVEDNSLYVLNIECTSVYSAHTLWILENAEVEFEEPERAFARVVDEVLHRAMHIRPGNAESHELFVLTCSTRFEMALRNVATHLICAERKPKRVLILSFDDLTPLKCKLPAWCEYLSGADEISNSFLKAGLSKAAIEKIQQENMFAKYAAPRLLMGSRVIVSDDDVIWGGPAFEMLTCQKTFFFLEDLPGFYGKASMELFRAKGLVENDAMKAPFLCAGLYLLNECPIRDASQVSRIIENAENHRDEQSAVGMETRMYGCTYEIGRYPMYHHGGYGPQPIPEKFDVMHLQGYLMTLRDHVGFQLRFLHTALESIACRRLQILKGHEGTGYGVFIPLHPRDAELLELNLARAAEIGALENAAMLYIVENTPSPESNDSKSKQICDRFNVTHHFANDLIGPFSLQQTRQQICQMQSIFESNERLAWLIRCDADVLLDEDTWRFLAETGNERGLDICADIRPDFRFDRRGYLIMPCAAFSRNAIEKMATLLNNTNSWDLTASGLASMDDVDFSLLARLLRISLDSPDGKMGYHTVRDIASIEDYFRSKGRPKGELAASISSQREKIPTKNS